MDESKLSDRKRWNRIWACDYDRVSRIWDRSFVPGRERLLDLARLRSGERVLDVGTGTGAAALLAARRVGPKGYVLGIDASRGMLEKARMKAASSSARVPWTFNRLMITLACADLILALLVYGGFSLLVFLFIGPFLIPAIIFTALLLWKPKPWIHLAAGIAISYPFILFLPFVIAILANPADPYSYAGNVLGLLSVAWALPAGVRAFLQARKGRPQLSARAGWHSWQGIYSVGVALLAIGAGLTSAAAYNYALSHPGGAFDFDPQASITVTAENFLFSPSDITVSRQTLTEIVVVNKDTAFHTFTYEVGGKEYSHDLLPSTTTRFLVFFDTPQTIPFWCIPHRGSGMTGEMTVS